MFWKPEYEAKEIIVGLDFDGVLAHGLKAKIKYAKEWFGFDLALDQTKEKGFNALMKSLGKKVNYRNLMDPLNEQHIMEYEIAKDCKAILERLYSESFRFVVVTSRNEHDYPYAKMFIEKNFSGIIKYMHNTNDEPKERFVKRLRIRAYMDDDLKKLIELRGLPCQLIYHRQPENSSTNLPLIGRSDFYEVRTWIGFYDVMHHIKDMHEAVCWANGIRNDSFHLKEIDEKCRKMNMNDKKRLIEECKNIKKAA
ncbi:MAG: hypothetical protein NT001_05875 [Candidatus Woesearchaeota archaeon]|nr:hypothetical protein [Candidatus Woesearchaeota archaeon]